MDPKYEISTNKTPKTRIDSMAVGDLNLHRNWSSTAWSRTRTYSELSYIRLSYCSCVGDGFCSGWLRW
ncbi:hypothetical protein F8388_015540 [Cannabis sativa]|uniref:Uncharacterized protein n=1 Tax=Cannabis sativa TaxID=3483 RepID=A0A7J6GIK5_CANSA|nr:hypothetical protein F8388_015540 [Cannabis sativa]